MESKFKAPDTTIKKWIILKNPGHWGAVSLNHPNYQNILKYVQLNAPIAFTLEQRLI